MFHVKFGMLDITPGPSEIGPENQRRFNFNAKKRQWFDDMGLIKLRKTNNFQPQSHIYVRGLAEQKIKTQNFRKSMEYSILEKQRRIGLAATDRQVVVVLLLDNSVGWRCDFAPQKTVNNIDSSSDGNSTDSERVLQSHS